MARARITDPETSHEAARSVSNISETQRAIYYLLLSKPSDDTDGYRVYTIAANAKLVPMLTESGYRSRRSELVDFGLVMDSGSRAKLPSGRSAIIWQTKPVKKSFRKVFF
jgi:hypothetical protein